MGMIPVSTGPVRAKSRVTLLLILVNVVVYLITTYDKMFLTVSDYWVDKAALIPVALMEPAQWYRFVTSMFLHGGLFHIFFNMYFLYLFGREVEGVLGSLRFFVLYMLSGIAASIFHVALTAVAGIYNIFIPALGASGAISGVLGAYLLLFPHKRMTICWFFWLLPWCFTTNAAYFLIFWFATQVIYGYARFGGVAFFAHAGGFVGGMLLLALLAPKWVREARFRVGWDVWRFGYYFVERRGLGKFTKGILALLLLALLGGAAYAIAEAGSIKSGIYIYSVEASMPGAPKAEDFAVYSIDKGLVLAPTTDAARVALNRLYWAKLLTGPPNTVTDSFHYKGVVRTTIEGTPVSVRLDLTAYVKYDKYGVLTQCVGKMVTDVIQISPLGVRLERSVPITVNISAEGPVENVGKSLIAPAAILSLAITLPAMYVVLARDRELVIE